MEHLLPGFAVDFRQEGDGFVVRLIEVNVSVICFTVLNNEGWRPCRGRKQVSKGLGMARDTEKRGNLANSLSIGAYYGTLMVL